jgi:hypothetical protein
VIVSYEHGTERARVTGLRGVRRLLGRAALDDDAKDRAVDDLHRGHAVVLVEHQELAASETRARLEHVRREA